jgi:hypothetical protein
MFVSKAGAYPNEAPFRCSTLGHAPGLTNNHTMLERLAREKHSSLLQTFRNYKTNYLNEEVDCTEPSPSVRIPGSKEPRHFSNTSHTHTHTHTHTHAHTQTHKWI